VQWLPSPETGATGGSGFFAFYRITLQSGVRLKMGDKSPTRENRSGLGKERVYP